MKIKTFKLHSTEDDLEVCYISSKKDNRIVVLQYLFETTKDCVLEVPDFKTLLSTFFAGKKITIVKGANVCEKGFSVDYSEIASKNKAYTIITTWNGEGYSSDNKKVGTLHCSTPKFARDVCRALMETIENLNGSRLNSFYNGWGWTDKEDCSGSYQFFKNMSRIYGFVIEVNINHVIPCTKEEFDGYKKAAIADADIDELEGLDEDSFFIPTNTMEYDYQFIKL